jgi:hypothetical protein
MTSTRKESGWGGEGNLRAGRRIWRHDSWAEEKPTSDAGQANPGIREDIFGTDSGNVCEIYPWRSSMGPGTSQHFRGCSPWPQLRENRRRIPTATTLCYEYTCPKESGPENKCAPIPCNIQSACRSFRMGSLDVPPLAWVSTTIVTQLRLWVPGTDSTSTGRPSSRQSVLWTRHSNLQQDTSQHFHNLPKAASQPTNGSIHLV